MNDYRVEFINAPSYDWFYTIVKDPDGNIIGNKAVCRNHVRAARWARRRILTHSKAVKILGSQPSKGS